jgi:hypothetical protein
MKHQTSFQSLAASGWLQSFISESTHTRLSHLDGCSFPGGQQLGSFRATPLRSASYSRELSITVPLAGIIFLWGQIFFGARSCLLTSELRFRSYPQEDSEPVGTLTLCVCLSLRTLRVRLEFPFAKHRAIGGQFLVSSLRANVYPAGTLRVLLRRTF